MKRTGDERDMSQPTNSPGRTWRPSPPTWRAWSPARTTTRTASWAPTNTAITPSSGRYRPHAAEVVALVGDDRFPLQHIESGLFAVALPFVNLIDYRLEVSYERLRAATSVADAYRFLPTLGRGRSAPVRRGPPRAAVGSPGRASSLVHHGRRRRRRRVVRGVGAQRQGRQPDRRVQRLDRQRSPDAGAGLVGGLGVVLARVPRSTACTSSACTAPTASSPTGPTRWRSPPRCRRRPHPG